MHDALVREAGVPESFFTAWRHEWFHASANVSRRNSRQVLRDQEGEQNPEARRYGFFSTHICISF